MKQVWGKLPYAYKVRAGLVLTFLLFMGVTCLMIQSVNDYMANRQRLAQITQIEVQREAYFSSLQDAETGQRGFVITGDEHYLAPYYSALHQLPELGRSLENSVENAPFQREYMRAIESLVQLKLTELQSAIRLRRTAGFKPAAELVAKGVGKHTMDKIRRVLGEMQRRQEQQLSMQTNDTRQSVDYMLKMLGISQILALGLLLFLYGIIYREGVSRSQAEQSLQESKDSLEQIVDQRTRELRQSNQELEQFAFVASHDLQAPLRKIQMFLELFKKELEGQCINPSAQDYLTRVEKSTVRMRDLIIDLLAISRINRSKPVFKMINLNDVAVDAVDELSEVIQGQGGLVEVGALGQIDADPEQMRQLLINLIGNALKYHRAGIPPVIKVSSRQEVPDRRQIVIADNGMGIPQEYRGKIFEIFQRLHGSNYEGNGIGLSIVKRIVERHGGSVEIDSEVGKGSQFIIDLPIHPGVNA